MEGLPHPKVFKIIRTGKKKDLTRQTKKDLQVTHKRLRENQNKLSEVREQLELIMGKSPQKKKLLRVANSLSRIHHIPIDRLARRSRDCLLCWFCEHWDIFSHNFLGINLQGPRNKNEAEIVQDQADEFWADTIRDPFDDENCLNLWD